MSKTYNEIKNQYQALRKTFDYMSEQKNQINQFYKEKKSKSITFIGSGSSYFISQSLEIIAKVKMGISCSAIAAGDLMLNTEKYSALLENTLIVAISRSGSTSEIINAINNVKCTFDVPVLSIICTYDSELANISDLTLEIPWAFDESVCQTRTVSNMYSVGLHLISIWSNDIDTMKDIEAIIDLGNEFMEKYEEDLKSIAIMDWENVTVLADGELQGIAMEAALAFKEISQLHSSYNHVLDSRHGPIVMIGKDSLVIACITQENYNSQVALIKDIVKKGAKVIVYTDAKVNEIEGVMLHVYSGKLVNHAVRGIPFIYVSQIVAYYKAIHRGTNPDKPDGLDAWIKL